MTTNNQICYSILQCPQDCRTRNRYDRNRGYTCDHYSLEVLFPKIAMLWDNHLNEDQPSNMLPFSAIERWFIINGESKLVRIKDLTANIEVSDRTYLDFKFYDCDGLITDYAQVIKLKAGAANFVKLHPKRTGADYKLKCYTSSQQGKIKYVRTVCGQVPPIQYVPIYTKNGQLCYENDSDKHQTSSGFSFSNPSSDNKHQTSSGFSFSNPSSDNKHQTSSGFSFSNRSSDNPFSPFVNFAEVGRQEVQPQQQPQLLGDTNSFANAYQLPIKVSTVVSNTKLEASKSVSTSKPNNSFSKIAIEWIEYIEQKYGYKIQHEANGGEFKLPDLKIKVDGYHKATNTVYEFHGDFWHGNPLVHKADEINPRCNKTYGELYRRTFKRDSSIRRAGYQLVVMWESDWKELRTDI